MIDEQILTDQRFYTSTTEKPAFSFTLAFAFLVLIMVNLAIVVVGLPVIIASQVRRKRLASKGR